LDYQWDWQLLFLKPLFITFILQPPLADGAGAGNTFTETVSEVYA
jgi:hypothetical protein